MTVDDVAKALGLLLIGSEVLSLTPWTRSNGWIQLVFRAMKALGREFGQKNR